MMITLSLGAVLAIPGGRGRRDNATIEVIDGFARHCARTARPTQPVQPVRMIFIGK